MRTIAIVNQKGGSGKTTTAINLAAVYAQRGIRTLLVDMDPQAHCAVGLGVPERRVEYSLAEALVADLDVSFDPSLLVWEVSKNLFLAPSTVRLAALEAPGGGLHRLPDRDRRLARLLHLLRERFDCCLVDCPPTIGLLTFNALRACREALVPVETGFFAMKGAERQWSTIQRTIERIGRPIACHLVPTLHRPHAQVARDILAALRRDFAGQITPVVIHERESLREAASFGQPIVEYAPHSAAHRDFEQLADWLDAHHSQPLVEIEIDREAARSAPPPLLAERSDGDRIPALSATPRSRAAELVQRVQGSPPAEPSREIAPSFPDRSAERSEPAEGIEHRRSLIEEIRGATHAASPPEERAVGDSGHPVDEAAGPADADQLDPGRADPEHADSGRAQPEPELEHADANRRIAHLLGVRQTSQGMLFVQPGSAGTKVAVAGDFNRWSPVASPLRYNPQLHVFQAIMPFEPGTYRYRLIIDGRWQSDPYNERRELNEYGEPISVFTVSCREASNDPHRRPL